MAIQSRRGKYSDFDPNRLLPGEWAVVQSGHPDAEDGEAVYMAFSAGSVKRMATHEDVKKEVELSTQEIAEELATEFEADITSDIQAAQTAANNANTAATRASNSAAQAAQSAAAFTVDKTLTVSDKAADAKTVGDQLSALKDDLSENGIANAFDGELFNGYWDTSGVRKSYSNDVCNAVMIDCAENAKVKITAKTTVTSPTYFIYYFDANNSRIQRDTGTGTSYEGVSPVGTKKMGFCFEKTGSTKNDYSYVGVYINNSIDIVSDTIDAYRADLSKISGATRNINTAGLGRYRSINALPIYINDANYAGMTDIIPCEASTTYTATFFNVGIGSIRVSYYSSDKSYLSENHASNIKSYTFTTPANAAYVHVWIYNANSIPITDDSKIQVENGNVSTPYIPVYTANDYIARETDDTLKVSKKAADAKKVGDDLEELKAYSIELSSKSAGGYSLDSNNAWNAIENFDYGGSDNPWVALENLDNFETYGTYLDNKISSIPSGSSFIWITDVHYTTNKKHSGALVDYVRRKTGIKTILHGGDIQNERPYAIDAAKDWLNFNKDYVGRIGSDFKQVCGDHDHNGQFWGKPKLREQYGLTDPEDTFFTCKFVQKVLTGYCENDIVVDTIYDDAVSGYEWSANDIAEYNAFKKMHYYFDDLKAKTRFIVLFTDWGWTDYGFPYSKLGSISAIYVQKEFLYEALMTLPNNYNVIICGHDTVHTQTVTEDNITYFDPSQINSSTAWKEIVSILNGFRNKANITARYADWSASYQSISEIPYKTFEFSSAPDANFVMTIAGDTHIDILSKTIISQRPVTYIPLSSGDEISKATAIPHVVTMTDGADRSYLNYVTKEPFNHPATSGTIHEQAFDVVTINDEGVFFTRIGSGSDRSLLFAEET